MKTTMKKIGLCVLGLMLVFTLISTGGAQGVKVGGEADNAKEIVITGEIDLIGAYLDSGITSILNGVPVDTDNNPATIPNRTHDKSAFLTVPVITLNFDIDVGEKVTAFIQLQNRVLGTATTWIDTNADGNVDTEFGVGGTAAYVDVLGGDNTEMQIQQAYIKVSEFLLPELTFTYGIQDLKFTLRKGEGAFFMDVAGSELATVPTVSQPENWAFNPTQTQIRDTTEFGGMKFDYGNLENDNYAVCFFYGTVNETANVHGDEALKGLQLDYNLPGDGNILKVILANIASDQLNTVGAPFDVSHGMSFWTMGAGVVYQAMPEQLEVYGEMYLQTGDYMKKGYFNDVLPVGITPDLPTKSQDQDATALRLGGRYNVDHDLKPYFDLSYWSLSGDKGELNKDNEDFVSYENVQSTLILEGNLLGLDLDSNYTAIKLETGITTQLDINSDGTGEELTLKLLYGMFNLAAKPHTLTYSVVGRDFSDDLGTEIDIVATLKYSESLSFSLGYGMVSGADYFEGVDTDLNTIADTGFMMDKGSMTLFMFDTKLKF